MENPLRELLEDQVAEVVLGCREVRGGDPRGVHRARVGCRRLRSSLAMLRPLLDVDAVDRVRAELAWLGRTLSQARDDQVMEVRLRGLVDELPRRDVVGPVRRRLTRRYAARRRDASAALSDALRSPRLDELLEALPRLVQRLAGSTIDPEAVRAVLRRQARRDWSRLRKRVEASRGVAPGADRDAALHEARKAAKRLRYAAEVLESTGVPGSLRLRRAATDLTSVLGEQQDTVVSREHLLEITAAARAHGERTDTYERLASLETTRAEQLVAEFAVTWDRMRDRHRRGRFPL